MKPYGSQSMVAPLRRVMVRRPDESFAVEDPAVWHYAGKPDLSTAKREHDSLVGILRAAGADVVIHDERLPGMADSIFVFDPAIITDEGAIILKMGKSLRCGEEAAMERQLSAAGVPVLARLKGDAIAEGGDLLWLDHQTLVVGIGFRTNLEGFRQLDEVLSAFRIKVLGVDLPYWNGAEACLHLLSLISLVDTDLAVIYPRLLPVQLWQELEDREFDLVEVSTTEFSSMGPNVLALEPRKCLILNRNPVTQGRLEQLGCEVLTYEGSQISLMAEGGPTCLTRPIWRQS